jgi:hypothetical protein
MKLTFEMIITDLNKLIWETKRYLRVPAEQADPDIDQAIFSAIEELKARCEPKYSIMIFPIQILEDGQNITVENTNFGIQSRNLTKFLKDSQKLAIMAATIGIQADKLIKKEQYSNLMQSMVIDATASAMVELVCDYAENKLRQDLIPENAILTPRFSPGYGDLDINIQPKILNLLDATKYLGITVTEQNYLIPTKSVTAFMGIKLNERLKNDYNTNQINKTTENQNEKNDDLCKNCIHKKACYYLEKGEKCEYRRNFTK